MPSDINYSKIIFNKTPRVLHPYITIARLDRPIGTWLLLFPCLWSIILAKGSVFNLNLDNWKTILLFSLGAILMRSAGCIINDIWDRKLDASVERTKIRPLASGEVSIKKALLLLCFLLLFSFLILITLSNLAIILGIFSLLPIIFYPKMKTLTWWPQLFLGFTFNWGALLGWAAINNSLALPAFIIYLGGVFWTLAYDTVYAHQDKHDDELIGIKSTARLFADNSKIYVSIFYILASLLFISAKLIVSPSVASSILSILPLVHIIWQVKTWDMNNSDSCLKIFKSNKTYGWLIVFIFAI